jgi:ParB-like chromosome segregation protein Spo0J
MSATDTTTDPPRVKFHEAADGFDLMKGEPFDELVGDIQRRGLHVPITTVDDDNGGKVIIDGRNRYRACLKAGVEPKFTEFKGKDEEIVRYIISCNIHRRHLSPWERRDLLVKLLKLHPEKSNRSMAKAVGVSHPYVAKVRKELEKSGDVETVSTRTDTKSRRQPARKKAAVNGGSHKNGSELAIEGTKSKAIEPDASDAEPSAVVRKKPNSKSGRWSEACQTATAAIEELIELQGEYQSWRDNLPENLQDGGRRRETRRGLRPRLRWRLGHRPAGRGRRIAPRLRERLMRARLPNRRASVTFEVEVSGLKYTCTFLGSLTAKSQNCSSGTTRPTARPIPTPVIARSSSLSPSNAMPIRKSSAERSAVTRMAAPAARSALRSMPSPQS